MKPEIIKISQISPDQSVVCILGKNEIPAFLSLSKSEKEYALKQLRDKEELVFINSYFKCTYFVKVKEGISGFREKEELRKAAAGMKNLIKSNNHSELVITSASIYKGAVEDFTEGLLLSFYAFDKYKTKDEDEKKKNYPSKLLLYGDTGKTEIKWLNDLTDAAYFVRDLINEPVNHLNATALGSAIEKIGKSSGFKVEVLSKGKIEALKMGGLLAVNKATVEPPDFCILQWTP